MMKKLLQSKISLFSSYFFLQGITGCCVFCFFCLFVCFVYFGLVWFGFWYPSVEDKRGGRGSGVQILLERIIILWPPIERSGVILVYSTQFPGCGMTIITLPGTNQTTLSDIFGRLLPFCACVLEHEVVSKMYILIFIMATVFTYSQFN